MPGSCNLPYTLAFRIPVKFRSYLATCHRKLSSVCQDFEPPEIAHITVKYLGQSSDYLTDKRVVSFLPRIAELVKEFIPLSIYVRGFDTFYYEEGRSPVIFLKVLPNEKLLKLHQTICEEMGNEIDIFPHADGENFQPHITISKHLIPGAQRKLNRIIFRSKRGKKRMLKLYDMVVFSPNRMFHVSKEQHKNLICPPVK